MYGGMIFTPLLGSRSSQTVSSSSSTDQTRLARNANTASNAFCRTGPASNSRPW
jgi:hypothetical protein